MIKRHDTLHYSRVLHNLERVSVHLHPSALAHYNSSLNACVFDERFVLAETTTLQKIACTIVHEATHARLDGWGIDYDEASRYRIEAICIRVAREQPDENAKPLPEMPLPEQVVADYQTVRLSLKGHPMEFLRERFTSERVVACQDVNHTNDKRRIRCAGVVLVRQRPGSAKGVVFMTLEDETGIANIVVWPKVMEQYRKEVMGARLILVEGYIQSSPEDVTHLVAQRMFDRSHDLIGLANDSLEPQTSGAGRPRADRAAQRRPPRTP